MRLLTRHPPRPPHPLACRAAGRAWLFATALPVLALATPAAAQLVADAWEPAPQINAGRLLPATMLQSSSHRLRDEVRVDASGNLLVFGLESDFGNYELTSEILLRERVHEVQVLAQAIDQFRRADAPLAQRLRGQLEVGADSWVDIVTSPFSTSGQLLQQLAGNVGQTLHEFGEFPDAPAPAAHAGALAQGDSALAAHQRNIASQLGLDAYSSNPRVQSFLDAVAQARASSRSSAGALSVRVAGTGVREVANGAIDAAVREALTRNTPQVLDAAIAQTLLARDVPERLVSDFLANPALSMRHRSVIAAHLDFMQGVDGVAHVIDSARRARDEVEALAFESVSRMLALYHEDEAPLAHIRNGGALPVAETRAGALVWALPVDLLYWNEETARAVDALTAGADGRRVVLLLPGIATERAQRMLAARGVQLHQRFLYRR